MGSSIIPKIAEPDIDLAADVVADGEIALSWSDSRSSGLYHLLIVRTGAVRAFTAIRLGGETCSYTLSNLGRHQRYRISVLGSRDGASRASSWLSVTPQAGLRPRRCMDEPGIEPYLATVTNVSVMPQDRRLTAYWRLQPGFVDRVRLEILRDQQLVKAFDLEPEVTSLSVDRGRGLELQNGAPYELRLATLFASFAIPCPETAVCCPAPRGEERAQNCRFRSRHLVYPFVELGPELAVFEDDVAGEGGGGGGGGGEGASSGPAQKLRCCHCAGDVHWQEYRLLCSGCRAEFIPNGRGAFLETRTLRFGTCKCCLPRKILVRRQGSDSLVCAHSGKEHIPLADGPGYQLIEDLPFGLCQCCRPRRPLLRKDAAVVCQKSGEKHRSEQGRWVLVPSEPVFDATAIDALLDAGLAEIGASGISRARRS
ncbi:MAG: fibronectin type III domain-containing protein [Candidatus Schekmanbacteria bacterium]|nr:fibronectin type III domain-containing protein [Candidatus Schekmanbacteria bacterium]